MHHLLRDKSYSCIKYFIFGNEPNKEVGDWDRWKAGVLNVAAAFRKSGIDRDVAILGSDHSGGNEWHVRAVDELQEELGGYDVHRYADEGSVRSGNLHLWFKGDWDYALARDPLAAKKPMVVGEAGAWVENSGTGMNPLHLDLSYGIFMADYAVQAANAGSSTVLAWMLDDNSHPGFTWGMWKNHSNGLELKPWFYPWALLMRKFRPGSVIVETSAGSPDLRVLAARQASGGTADRIDWSFCLVNLADRPMTVSLQIEGFGAGNFERFLFSKAHAPTDAHGFPIPSGETATNSSGHLTVLCEPQSVTVLSGQ
jgi:hypothetical protein